MNLTPEMLFVIFAIVFGVACNGAIKLFYKYNTLLVIAYIVFLFPIALAHSLLIRVSLVRAQVGEPIK